MTRMRTLLELTQIFSASCVPNRLSLSYSIVDKLDHGR